MKQNRKSKVGKMRLRVLNIGMEVRILELKHPLKHEFTRHDMYMYVYSTLLYIYNIVFSQENTCTHQLFTFNLPEFACILIIGKHNLLFPL